MRTPISLAILAVLAGTADPFAQSSALAANPPGSAYKIIAPKGALSATTAGADLIQDYGSFALYRAATSSLDSAKGALAADPEMDVLQFTAQPFDTQRGSLTPPAPFSLQSAAGAALQIVQFVGPVKKDWLDALSARGIRPLQYVASNGYIVWADEAAQAQLAGLRTQASWLQFAAPFYAFLKIDPNLQQRLNADPASSDEIDVTVQIYRHDGDGATRQFVQSRGLVPTSQQAPLGTGTVNYAWAPILKFANLSLRVHVADVAAIAERPDVTFVGLKPTFKLMDAKQVVIMTGDFAPSPASVDYVQFLTDHGFSHDPNAYPIVDLTDSTIDEGGTGVTVLNTADVKLHVAGDAAQPSRVVYFHNCSSTPDDQVGAIDGHGSFNAGIIAGYDQRNGFPYQDSDGFQLGLGVNPFVRIGSTAIFVPGFDTTACGNNAQGLVEANWQNGAKISSNSWGSSLPPTTYDDTDQVYDAGVRDADPSTAGNQELIYVVAAANSGPSAATISSPAGGKNVITVGASENIRPDWTDGCGTGPSGADNANDIADFSSRGPAPGNRVKPEVIAPGSHIQSGASNFSGYDGSGVCDKYHPDGQTEFAASSGTSHSTPAISGLASLAYWWIAQGGAGDAVGKIVEVGGPRAPSPALMKAWLMAHPMYLDGVGANDDLPSNSQGYGMPNMSDMFSTTPKVLLDQSDLLTMTGDARSYIWGVADPTRPLRIALAYTDAPGALGTSPQVNDLDLAVTVNGQTYLGNHFDHQWSTTGGTADNKNNYEAVFLPAGSSGEVTVTVTASNIAGDATASGNGPNQDFALACNNCNIVSTFTLASAQPAAQVCSGGEVAMAIHLGQVGSFADPVSLSASGVPNGSNASFNPNPATPPDNPTLTIVAQASATPGTYPLTITGTAGSITKSLGIDLGIYDVVPPAPALDSPPADSSDVSQLPMLTWEAAPQGYSYLVQIASDAAFTHVVASTETLDTSWTLTEPQLLASSTRYWWRVIARNPCGDSAAVGPTADTIFEDGFDPAATIVGAQTFTTLAQPGDCSVDVTPTIVFSDDMENGAGAWTHGAAIGSVDSWALGDAAHRGTQAWQADAPPAGTPNDQYLISPSIALPNDLSPLSLEFWNQQSLKSLTSSSCQDGAVVEISSDDGSTWTQIPGSKLLTDPYNGPISSSFGNPLANHQGWCGDPQAYLNSIVNLQGYAGQTVKFRFRLGHDRFDHRSDPNWAIDDVSVRGCAN
ncbi:MAG: S8 family serine peptidase [Dokdonella sp.]